MGCISMFYDLLYTLEDTGILDPSDSVDLFALHYMSPFSASIVSLMYFNSPIQPSSFQLLLRELTEQSGDDRAIQGVWTNSKLIKGKFKKKGRD